MYKNGSNVIAETTVPFTVTYFSRLLNTSILYFSTSQHIVQYLFRLQHEITGRVLVRINETKLLRLGVNNADHRQEIWREILKLKLKTDVLEIRDMQRKQMYD